MAKRARKETTPDGPIEPGRVGRCFNQFPEETRRRLARAMVVHAVLPAHTGDSDQREMLEPSGMPSKFEC